MECSSGWNVPVLTVIAEDICSDLCFLGRGWGSGDDITEEYCLGHQSELLHHSIDSKKQYILC